MLIRSLETSGFGARGDTPVDLDRVTRLVGSADALAAVADALHLAFATWDRALLADLLDRWGCRNARIDADPQPVAAAWRPNPGLAGLLDPAGGGIVTVGITAELDPPLYGLLRKEAARDPRLVDALAEGATLTARTGFRFAPGLDGLGVEPLSLAIGGISFAQAGPDRPGWMPGLLRRLAGRLCRGAVGAATWSARAGSYLGPDRDALERALGALAAPPFSLGAGVMMPEGPAVRRGSRIVPISLLGQPAGRACGLVGAVHLSGAEILLVEDPPPGLEPWLAAAAEADGSPLEQVVLLGSPGGRPVD